MINEEAIATAYPTGEKVLFKVKDLASTYYNNDLMEMYRDLGRKIPMEARREFKGTSLDFERINEAVRKADKLMSSVTKYDKLLRRLGAPVEITEVEQIEQEALTAVTAPDTSGSQGVSTETLSKLGSSSNPCLLYTSPSPRDGLLSRMPSSA